MHPLSNDTLVGVWESPSSKHSITCVGKTAKEVSCTHSEAFENLATIKFDDAVTYGDIYGDNVVLLNVSLGYKDLGNNFQRWEGSYDGNSTILWKNIENGMKQTWNKKCK